MPTISEAQLSTWTKPAFANEDERRQNTENMIRAAIKGHSLLRTLDLAVYAKGSYKNNTNVRRDSDVDVAVEYRGIFFFDSVEDNDAAIEAIRRYNAIEPYDGPFRTAGGVANMRTFKDAVGEAMTRAFGTAAVIRGNKVFTVRESSRSLAADVIPCTKFRLYNTPSTYADGIRLLPDRWPGHSTENYPEQHYDSGVTKNDQWHTSRRYKSVVRILKNLENRMVADGASPEVPGFLIECLAFNAPDRCFKTLTWADSVRAVLSHIWAETEDVACEQSWTEVNEIKYLFHSDQKWTRAEARSWVYAAWQYVADS